MASNETFETQNKGDRYNKQQKKFAAISDVAIWDLNGEIKLFGGSYDGHWRLWNLQNMSSEVDHNMEGKIECLEVASDFLFCGFEGTSIKVPGVTTGMIHAWNLKAPDRPPLEFHMGPLTPYAHASSVSSFLVQNDMCVSGCHNGVIRLWKYDPAIDNGGGGFALVSTLCGHAAEITGLAVVQNMLWSVSIDMTIRIWDMSTFECKCLISQATQPTNAQPTSPSIGVNAEVGIGHTAAITGIIPFESQAAGGSFVITSSLDGNIKVWNSANGECMQTTTSDVGITCICLGKDTKENPILLCGMENGKIYMRSLLQTQNVPGISLLVVLDRQFQHVGHDDAVKCIKSGPSGTFYSGGSDGRVTVWQIVDSLL
eukprot:CAMPEP_0184865702 /NCGR_PEP_ID=MMETSP0580-20130426/18806_1 /TAXON_ID=1118495 /ORGANISM="Dactyliosolen fragilissimus" /LENGTH=370 /DNA_ID=CAMNT_0027364997 /DNA_START=617 /DNA_END=1729 /DNA_ORIENTATION=+